MGNSVEQCIQGLEKAGASVVGSNCTINSEEMVELVQIMRSVSSLPLIAQANAGKPSLSEEGKVFYSQGIEDYLRFIPKIIENGANLVGGCCGTDPDYIREMAKIIMK
jgi:5-methyltetrahydrofolate--homocysteine methyltransferase